MVQKEVDITYLAGMMDADGSFCIVKSRNGYEPRASISNGCRPMLEWCAAFVDQPHSITLKKKQKDYHSDNYDLKWSYNAALAVAALVRNHLRVKSRQAKCICRWSDVVKRNGRYTKTELQCRNDLVAEIKLLNT